MIRFRVVVVIVKVQLHIGTQKCDSNIVNDLRNIINANVFGMVHFPGMVGVYLPTHTVI